MSVSAYVCVCCMHLQCNVTELLLPVSVGNSIDLFK